MRGELLHLLIFAAVCLIAYMRSALPDFREEEVYIRGKVVGDILQEVGSFRTRVLIEESELEEIEGRTALLRVYGYLPVDIRELSLIGSVSVKSNRVFVSAGANDVEYLKPSPGIRDLLMERYRRASGDDPVASLGLSFLFGEPRELLPSETQRGFLRTGLVHLLVVSGLHVGAVALVLSKMLPRFWGLRLSLAGVLLYTLFVVPHNPPVLRASLMFVLILLCLLTFRRPNTPAILLFSGSVILLIFPHYLFSYSFWLSFFATAYIVLMLEGLEGRGLFKTALVSLSAFTGTAPLVSTFSHISPLSVLFTPLLTPVVLVYSLFGVVSLLTFMSLPPFVELFNLLGDIFRGSVNLLSGVSLQVYPSLSFWEAVVLTLSGAVSLYLLRGAYRLVPLAVINCWLLVRGLWISS